MYNNRGFMEGTGVAMAGRETGSETDHSVSESLKCQNNRSLLCLLEEADSLGG